MYSEKPSRVSRDTRGFARSHARAKFSVDIKHFAHIDSVGPARAITVTITVTNTSLLDLSGGTC